MREYILSLILIGIMVIVSKRMHFSFPWWVWVIVGMMSILMAKGLFLIFTLP